MKKARICHAAHGVHGLRKAVFLSRLGGSGGTNLQDWDALLWNSFTIQDCAKSN